MPNMISPAYETALAIWEPWTNAQCEVEGHDWEETGQIWTPKHCRRCDCYYQIKDY